MVNLTKAFPKGTVGNGEIKAAYFATQAPFVSERCRFLCIDKRATSFAAEMGYKANCTFSPGGGKIDIGKSRGKRRLIVFGLKGGKGLNDRFVAKAVKTQAEVALRFQKRGEPTKIVQWHGREKLLHPLTRNDVKIGRLIFNVYAVSDISATEGECRLLSVWDALDNPDSVSDSLLEKAKLSAQKVKFAGGLEFVAHSLSAVICDEVFHSENDKPLTNIK